MASEQVNLVALIYPQPDKLEEVFLVTLFPGNKTFIPTSGILTIATALWPDSRAHPESPRNGARHSHLLCLRQRGQERREGDYRRGEVLCTIMIPI